jgi:hypothetical protein
MPEEECPNDECQRTTMARMARISEQLEELRAEMNKGFANDDPDGHRRHHELLIEREAQRVKLRNAIIEKTLSGLVWMFLCWIGIAIWQHFLNSVSAGRH